MLQTGETYTDPGGDFFARADPERTRKRLVTQLERLGYAVTLQEQAVAPMGVMRGFAVHRYRPRLLRHHARGRLGRARTRPRAETQRSIASIASGTEFGDETPPSATQVRALDAGGIRTLDEGPGLSLRSLELDGTTVSWVKDGVRKSATLR